MNEIIQKAKKLIALRDRAGTPDEAKAAARALAGLLEKHRISLTELESGGAPKERIIADTAESIISWLRGTAWRRELLDRLCEHYGVANWFWQKHAGFTRAGNHRWEKAFHLCGRPSDIAMVRYMFAWLSNETVRLGKNECAGRGRSFSNGWMLGFVDGIAKQLNAVREEVNVDEETALALRDRFKESEEEMYKQVEGLKLHSRSIKFDPVAHVSGRRRGEQHHLGDTLEAGYSRALPEAS